MSSQIPDDFMRLECLRIAHEASSHDEPELLLLAADMLTKWVNNGKLPKVAQDIQRDENDENEEAEAMKSKHTH